MNSLIVETGKHKGKRLRLPEGESIVGRDEEAQIRIASEEVSRTHCAIVSQTGQLVVRDLGSRNGTFVNGKPITGETALHPGDLLVIGPMGFRMEGPETEAPESKKESPRKVAKSDSQKLSDDDIAGWLSIGSGDAKSDADTAVLQLDAAIAGPSAPLVPQPKKTFRSTAEEAADIIRRHKEANRS